MRTIRGLQITSIVVLSPVLLIMLSLISMLLFSIYSHVNSYFFRSTIQHVQEQTLSTIKNASTDITILQQYNSTPHHHSVRRIRLFTRLRQSFLSSFTTIVICLYAAYIIFKKKRAVQQQEKPILSDQSKSEKPSAGKKKASKRRKTKKPSQKHQAPPINNLSHQEENSTVNKKKEQAINAQEKQDNVISDKCKKQPKTEVKTHVNNHFFPSPTYSCVSTSNSLDDKPDSRLDLISPETTPNHSEDEEEEGAEKKDNNWYSPFSTGLDLDILPKLNLMDPLCQYKIDFKYNINIPLQHHYYHSHHHSHPYFRSSLHSAQNVSCIKVLENHPFISSKDSHSTHHQHVFGPVGDRKKQ